MKKIAYRRQQRIKHIKRKENILRKYRLDNPPHKYNDSEMWNNMSFPIGKDILFEGWWHPFCIVKAGGYLNKGKIHCSCAMCSVKTRNKGHRRYKHGNYYPNLNYKHSDLKKIEHMNYEEKLYNNKY